MIRNLAKTLLRQLNSGYTVRLILIILAIIVIGFFATESSVKMIMSRELLQEKEVMLFGLATQLDNALVGTYDDILARHDALNLPRIEKISILHDELKDVTDFVASGVTGVGVGYYSKELDAIITYGPESQFGHTIGQPIFEGHLGYQVMATGKRMVQQGELVRGQILNCMHPIIRGDKVIGYIWSNETLEDVSHQLSIIFNQILIFTVIIFILLYVAVFLPTWYFNRRIDQLIVNIDGVMDNPKERLPKITGPLESVVRGVNSLLDKVFYFKSHNEYIFDSLKSGILAVSMEDEIVLANPTFLSMIKRDDCNLLGEKFRSVLPDDLCTLINKSFSKTNIQDMEIFIHEGSIYEVFTNDVYNDENKKIGLVLIFRDRTLIKLYERRLQEQQRLVALGEIGLTIAHEIKNPLTAVKGFTQLMNRRYSGYEKIDDYLKLMDDELNRIDKLLNELLVNGKKSGLQPEITDFGNMLNEFLIIYSNSYPDIKFNLSTRISSSPKVNIDKDRIAQLIDNLVKNGVEAIRDNPGSDLKTIDIDLVIDIENVIVKIRDSGKGIPDELMGRVMSPFFTTKQSGTGLGMSLCLGIVERHQGKFTIISEPGNFTEVTITFNRQKLESLNEL